MTIKMDSGVFGAVYKVEDEERKISAIKLFESSSKYSIKKLLFNLYFETGMNKDFIDIKYVLREIEVMMTVKGERIVKYFDSWMDSNDNIYIQMEFCSNNLKNILLNRQNVFPRSDSQPMNRIEFYICCQIFIELLEAVNYLHQYKPQPIIHRNLKPAKILFDDKGINGVFFKLYDFTLSIFQEDKSHTRFVGTMKYMSPEVRDGTHYGTKSDVYSLGIIGFNLFEIDIRR